MTYYLLDKGLSEVMRIDRALPLNKSLESDNVMVPKSF